MAAMVRRVLLVVVLMLGQMFSVPVVAASVQSNSFEPICCGGVCCCQPQMCGCMVPTAPQDTPQPAPAPTTENSRTILIPMLVTGIDLGDFEHIQSPCQRTADSTRINPATTMKRLAMLCVYRT